jgi:hypothetical protein
MVRLKAEVYTTAAIARLRKAEQKIMRTGEVSTQELVNMGKDFARAIVPKGSTRWLYNTIKGRVLKENNGSKGEIFLSPSIVPIDGVHRWSAGRYPQFNLARWSHTSPRAVSHFTNGDPKFMDTTREYLRGVGLNRVKGRFKTIKF